MNNHLAGIEFSVAVLNDDGLDVSGVLNDDLDVSAVLNDDLEASAVLNDDLLDESSTLNEVLCGVTDPLLPNPKLLCVEPNQSNVDENIYVTLKYTSGCAPSI